MAWLSSLAGQDDDFRTPNRIDSDSDYDGHGSENAPPCTPRGSQYQLVPEAECPQAPRRRKGENVPASSAADMRQLFRKLNVNRVSYDDWGRYNIAIDALSIILLGAATMGAKEQWVVCRVSCITSLDSPSPVFTSSC